MWRQLVIPSGLKCHIVRLKPGDALKGSLLEIVRDLDLRSAFILSCVGSVESFTLRYASNADGQCKTETREERMEILSLVGTLSGNDRGHLHASLGDSSGHVIGGHVIEMQVYTTAEIVIGELPEAQFARLPDPETNCEELIVSPRMR